MARSLFRDTLTDRKGNALSDITVTVYDEGTTTLVSDTLYVARTDSETLTNPFTATNGQVEFWLDSKGRVDVKYSSARITTRTVTLDGVSPDDLSTGGGGGVTDHGALTGLADDDHPQYETSAEAAAKITTHEGAANPHPTYETSAEAQAKVDTHSTDTTSVHGIADTSMLQTSSGSQAQVDTHINDTSDAHDASAISFAPAGTVAATNVQAAIEEVATEAGGGGGGFDGKTCHVYRSSNQTGLSTFAWNLITWNAEADDPDGFHSTSTNPSRIIPTVAGKYVFVVKTQLLATGAMDGSVGLGLRKNGAGTMDAFGLGIIKRASDAWSGDDSLQVFSFPVAMNGTTDYVEAFVWVDRDAGTPPNVGGGADSGQSYFACHKVSD